jgi:hypothetical protein
MAPAQRQAVIDVGEPMQEHALRRARFGKRFHVTLAKPARGEIGLVSASCFARLDRAPLYKFNACRTATARRCFSDCGFPSRIVLQTTWDISAHSSSEMSEANQKLNRGPSISMAAFLDGRRDHVLADVNPTPPLDHREPLFFQEHTSEKWGRGAPPASER